MNLSRKFKRAFKGLVEVFLPELSIKIEIVISLLVLAAAYYLRVTSSEFLALVGTIFLVIILEGMNTILERIIDLAEPRYHDAVRQIKDA
ncbi:MAG: diacylglycerol kinase family protein, partial [Candidatus Komeilibacteria bacterium]|nr:diacylglycerol kinase family protein [Candidatus Komeilibacteria bacterium]